MTALTFWLVFEAAVLGPYDTGLRLPTKQACQDIVDVIKAAALCGSCNLGKGNRDEDWREPVYTADVLDMPFARWHYGT